MAPDKIIIKIATGNTSRVEELPHKGEQYVSDGKVVVRDPIADKVVIQVNEGKGGTYTADCNKDSVCKVDDQKAHRSIQVFFAPSAAKALKVTPSEAEGLAIKWIAQHYKNQPAGQGQILADLRSSSHQFKDWQTYGDALKQFERYYDDPEMVMQQFRESQTNLSPAQVQDQMHQWIARDYKGREGMQGTVITNLRTISEGFKSWKSYADMKAGYDAYYKDPAAALKKYYDAKSQKPEKPQKAAPAVKQAPQGKPQPSPPPVAQSKTIIPFDSTPPAGIGAEKGKKQSGAAGRVLPTPPSGSDATETQLTKAIADAKTQREKLKEIIHDLEIIKKMPREQQLKVSGLDLGFHYMNLDRFEGGSWKALQVLKKSSSPEAKVAAKELQAARDVYNQWTYFVYVMVDQKTAQLVKNLGNAKSNLEDIAKKGPSASAEFQKAKRTFATQYEQDRKTIKDSSNILHVWKGKEPRVEAIRAHLKEMDAINIAAKKIVLTVQPLVLTEAEKKDLATGAKYLKEAKDALAKARNYKNKTVAEKCATFDAIDALDDNTIAGLIVKYGESAHPELKKMSKQLWHVQNASSQLATTIRESINQQMKVDWLEIKASADRGRRLTHSEKASAKTDLQAFKGVFALIADEFSKDIEASSEIIRDTKMYRENLKKLSDEMSSLSVVIKKADETKRDPAQVKLEGMLKKIEAYYGKKTDAEVAARPDFYKVAELFAVARRFVEKTTKDNPEFEPVLNYKPWSSRIHNAQKINIDFLSQGTLATLRGTAQVQGFTMEEEISWLKDKDRRDNIVKQAHEVLSHLERLLGPNRFSWTDANIISESHRDLPKWKSMRSWAVKAIALANNAKRGKFPQIAVPKEVAESNRAAALKAKEALIAADQAKAPSLAYRNDVEELNRHFTNLEEALKKTKEARDGVIVLKRNQLNRLERNVLAGKAALQAFDAKYNDYDAKEVTAHLTATEKVEVSNLRRKISNFLNNQMVLLEGRINSLKAPKTAATSSDVPAKETALDAQLTRLEAQLAEIQSSNAPIATKTEKIAVLKRQLRSIQEQAVMKFEDPAMQAVINRVKAILPRMEVKDQSEAIKTTLAQLDAELKNARRDMGNIASMSDDAALVVMGRVEGDAKAALTQLNTLGDLKAFGFDAWAASISNGFKGVLQGITTQREKIAVTSALNTTRGEVSTLLGKARGLVAATDLKVMRDNLKSLETIKAQLITIRDDKLPLLKGDTTSLKGIIGDALTEVSFAIGNLTEAIRVKVLQSGETEKTKPSEGTARVKSPDALPLPDQVTETRAAAVELKPSIPVREPKDEVKLPQTSAAEKNAVLRIQGQQLALKMSLTTAETYGMKSTEDRVRVSFSSVLSTYKTIKVCMDAADQFAKTYKDTTDPTSRSIIADHIKESETRSQILSRARDYVTEHIEARIELERKAVIAATAVPDHEKTLNKAKAKFKSVMAAAKRDLALATKEQIDTATLTSRLDRYTQEVANLHEKRIKEKAIGHIGRDKAEITKEGYTWVTVPFSADTGSRKEKLMNFTSVDSAKKFISENEDYSNYKIYRINGRIFIVNSELAGWLNDNKIGNVVR